MKQIQLAIPKPCHENWDAMTPEGRGRHCAACATTVVDFTTMSDAELLQFFTKEKKANTCGRVSSQQLNRNIIPAQNKPSGYRHYFAALLLLLLNKPVDTKAQKRPAIMGLVANTGKQPGTPHTVARAIPFNKYIFSGTVLDEAGQPVSFAVIKIAESGQVASANVSGQFTSTITDYPVTVEISANGFITKQVMINNTDENIILLAKTPIQFKMETDTFVTSELNSLDIVAGGITICRTKQPGFIDNAFRSIQHYFSPAVKVYPNPVKAGGIIKMELKFKQKGNYRIRITNGDRTEYLVKQIETTSKNSHEQIRTDSSWPSGIYYIQLTDEAGNNCGTNKLVVE